ncbi:uncharacterized protein LOC130407859 isoform X2 [Triplophysa dalaica]|uniref:uncharacterized protein LOC130407859 isoform X2 n=1 Tax=Triplophysa dalaica TaxID=1582913 RepID=UPI0024DFBE61|nr:uncharacterized protein LOC130407859 isoform X2 [Triplophysa dalaica]
MTVEMFLGCRCALFVALICAVSVVGAEFVKVGGEVRFKPNPTLSSGTTITWKYMRTVENVIRVIEFDHGESSSPQNPLFKDNAKADTNTGELTLFNLRKDHNGIYYFELNGKEQEQKFTLNVMEEVPQPELNKAETSNPDNAIYLECQYDTDITWHCTNKDTVEPISVNGQKIGESILFERTKNLDVCCTCTLVNQVSNKTSKPICESEIFSGSNKGLVLGLVIPAVVIIITLVVLIFLYMCSDSCHDAVRKKFGKTPCLGAMLNVLDSCRNKIKPKGENKLHNVTTVYDKVKTTEKNEEEGASNGPHHDDEEKPLNEKESQQ